MVVEGDCSKGNFCRYILFGLRCHKVQLGYSRKEWKRKTFPTEGIYTVQGSIASTYYLEPEHARRFRYVRPGEYARSGNVIADCWIVDKHGQVNPGTNVFPVPFSLSAIGRRILTRESDRRKKI